MLANLNGKLLLRKYEIVEPSLNSIFINVVGGSEKIEHANEKQIPSLPLKLTRKKLLQDAQVRKASLSLMGAIALTLGFTIMNGLKDTQHLILSAIFLAITVFSAFRFVQIKKKIEKEMTAKQSSGAQS